MGCRDVDTTDAAPPSPPTPPFGDLVLRTAPNWTAVGFFGALGAVHLSIAVATFVHGRWEAYMSLVFGTLFVIISAASRQFRYELAVQTTERRLRLRHGIGRFFVERFVPFKAVRGVRLTLCRDGRHVESKLELLCGVEDIECPPTIIPRQEALLFAMLMNVPLYKVSDETAPLEEEPQRLEAVAERRM